eukprot:364555-Chlamydomonas_euryale.AAC.9
MDAQLATQAERQQLLLKLQVPRVVRTTTLAVIPSRRKQQLAAMHLVSHVVRLSGPRRRRRNHIKRLERGQSRSRRRLRTGAGSGACTGAVIGGEGCAGGAQGAGTGGGCACAAARSVVCEGSPAAGSAVCESPPTSGGVVCEGSPAAPAPAPATTAPPALCHVSFPSMKMASSWMSSSASFPASASPSPPSSHSSAPPMSALYTCKLLTHTSAGFAPGAAPPPAGASAASASAAFLRRRGFFAGSSVSIPGMHSRTSTCPRLGGGLAGSGAARTTGGAGARSPCGLAVFGLGTGLGAGLGAGGATTTAGGFFFFA